jgi:hypothetical protein
MAITFEKSNPLGSLFQELGSGLEKRFEQRGLRQQQNQSRKGLEAVTSWASTYDSSKSPMENIGTLQTVLQQKGVDPATVQPILQDIIKKTIGQEGEQFGANQFFAQHMPAAGSEQESVETGSRDKMAQFSREDLVTMAANPNKIVNQTAKAEIEKRKLDQSLNEADRKYHTQFAAKQEEKIAGLRESIPKKKTALRHARNAVESGQVGAFSINQIADSLGGALGDTFRTSKGAQLITAGKENLLSNMTRVSAKAQNQWFEQRLASMFPKVGQTMEANLVIQEMLESELVMEEAYLNKFDQLQAEDEAIYGYSRKDVERRARQAVGHMEDLSFERSAYRLRQLEEAEMGSKEMRKNLMKKVQKGTPMTLEMGSLFIEKYKDPQTALENAKKLGYRVPNGEDLQLYLMSSDDFSKRLGIM